MVIKKTNNGYEFLIKNLITRKLKRTLLAYISDLASAIVMFPFSLMTTTPSILHTVHQNVYKGNP